MADETTETVEAPGLDMEAASDQIGASLFPETPETETPEPVEKVADALVDAPEKLATTTTPAASVSATPGINEVPKSWAKDTHDLWPKIDPKVQEYIKKRETDFLNGLDQYKGAAQYGKTLADVIAPYQPTLQAQGVDAPKAVQALLEAHYRLTNGTLAERQAAYADLGRNLRLPPTQVPQGQPDGTPPPVMDPRIQTLESQLQQIQSVMTTRERAEQARAQAEYNAALEKCGAEVNSFATATNKDGTPINAFFDEVHADMLPYISQPGVSLQEAYDKAVWANPVVREKQKLAYFQTESDKQRERARLDALPKQKARGVNVNGRDTHRTPTEPLGSLEDTMRSTYKSIQDRTVH